MLSPDRNQKHIIKDRNTAGSRSSPLPVLQVDHCCADENTSDGPQEETRPERSKKFSFFIFLSLCPSLFLSVLLSHSLKDAAQFNLSRGGPGAPVFPVTI